MMSTNVSHSSKANIKEEKATLVIVFAIFSKMKCLKQAYSLFSAHCRDKIAKNKFPIIKLKIIICSE